MAGYPPESTVMVRPFVRRRDGAEVIIGDHERRVYLALPPEALDILDPLAAGETVGEVARRYEAKHGEPVDMNDFLAVMQSKGFVGPAADEHEFDDDHEGQEGHHDHDHNHSHRREPKRSYKLSLDWITPKVASRLISGPALAIYFAIIGIGLAMWLTDPGVLPSPSVLLYPHGKFAVWAIISLPLTVVGTFIHELAHAVVARASGVPVTLAIGNLMYFVVAQTDISGLRMGPKKRLYLAFLAGVIIDLVVASSLLMIAYADRHGFISLPLPVQDLVGAVMLGYLFRVMFQTFFYLRTDLYYVVATLTGARNLMTDTERLLKIGFLRIFGKRLPPSGVRNLPRRERLSIFGYMALYLLGRVYSIVALIILFLPILVNVVLQAIQYHDGQDTHLKFIDFFVIAFVMVLFNGTGIVLWVRELLRYLRPRKDDADPVKKERVAVGS